VLVTVILGACAGFAAERAEPHIRRAVGNALMAEAPVTAVEWRLFSFSVCLVIAALLAWLFADGGGLALSIGAAVGVFLPRMAGRWRSGG